MNSTPLPNPSPFTCRNCGQGVEHWQQFCPHCGAAMQARPTNVFAVLGSIVLGCLSLVFGGFGACFILIGGVAIAGGDAGAEMVQFLGIGIVSALFMVGCIVAIIRLNSRR